MRLKLKVVKSTLEEIFESSELCLHLKERLNKNFEDFDVELDDNSIRVYYPSKDAMFPIWLDDDLDGSYIVGWGKLHEHIDIYGDLENLKEAKSFFDKIIDGQTKIRTEICEEIIETGFFFKKKSSKFHTRISVTESLPEEFIFNDKIQDQLFKL
jgi:hypothetical protein